MHSILEQNLAVIHDLCRANAVRKLWVIGSVLRKDFQPGSDIDFVVSYDDPASPPGSQFRIFINLLMGLKKALGREVDLIEYEYIRNPYFREEVDETKVLLYDQESEKVSVFRS